MTDDDTRSGDFLSDVDIRITLRSGKTDLVVIRKLSQAIVASVQGILDTEIACTEIKEELLTTTKGSLRTRVVVLRIN